MSTRSAIMVKVGKEIRGVFCHWDGYVDPNRGVGFQLLNNYNSEARALDLISNGAIDSLRPLIEGDIHTVNSRDDITVFYRRDYNNVEDWTDVVVNRSASKVLDVICDYQFAYLFKNGQWYVKKASRQAFKPLSEVMDKIKARQKE